MRTTEQLYGNGRRPAEPPIPFRQLLPMQLKDRVSGKKGHQNDVACIPEMMTLFSCLAENNYDSNNCTKEATAFQGCFNKFLKQNAQYKATGSLGILTPGLKASQLTSQQANALLKKYPIANLLKKVR